MTDKPTSPDSPRPLLRTDDYLAGAIAANELAAALVGDSITEHGRTMRTVTLMKLNRLAAVLGLTVAVDPEFDR